MRCGVWYGLVQCGVVRLREVSTHTLSCAQHLAPWLGSSDGTERERGSALLVDLMDAYQTQHATMEVSHSCTNKLVWGVGWVCHGGGVRMYLSCVLRSLAA